MYFNRARFLVVTFAILLFVGCAQKKQVIVEPVVVPVIEPLEKSVAEPINIKHGKFDALLKELVNKCQVVVVDEKNLDSNTTESSSDIGTHLKVDFQTDGDFKLHSFKLTKEAKEKLKCIIPLISNNEHYFLVQIVGHASDSISLNYNQYLSDNRAIEAADLFFKEGMDDTFAKGCPEKKETLDGVSEDDIFINRSLDIYIYTNEADIKNPCPQQ